MHKPLKTISIYYSRIISLPVLNYIIYRTEIWLVKRGLIRIVAVSLKTTPLFFKLVKTLSQKQFLIILKTYNFGYMLRHFNSNLVLDLKIRNYKKLSKEKLGLLMWTLVYVSAVTQRTKRSLKFIIPTDFPTV